MHAPKNCTVNPGLNTLVAVVLTLLVVAGLAAWRGPVTSPAMLVMAGSVTVGGLALQILARLAGYPMRYVVSFWDGEEPPCP